MELSSLVAMIAVCCALSDVEIGVEWFLGVSEIPVVSNFVDKIFFFWGYGCHVLVIAFIFHSNLFHCFIEGSFRVK